MIPQSLPSLQHEAPQTSVARQAHWIYYLHKRYNEGLGVMFGVECLKLSGLRTLDFRSGFKSNLKEYNAPDNVYPYTQTLHLACNHFKPGIIPNLWDHQRVVLYKTRPRWPGPGQRWHSGTHPGRLQGWGSKPTQ